MDIKPDLIKNESELIDFTESIVNIKSESEYNVPLDDIKTEKDLDIEMEINKTSGITIKQELCDDMWKVDAKTEEVPEIKEELNLNDNVKEKLPEIKTEEVILKNENEDGETETGLHWENDIQDHIMDNNSSCKEYGCDHCDYLNLQNSDLNCGLNIHIIAKHDENLLDKLCCDKCNYRTSNKLVKHDKDSIKKYSCDYTSQQQCNLNSHSSTKYCRNVSKKYSCGLCDYTAYEKSHLSRHILVKHDKDAIKPFSCDQCDYRTHFKCHLNYHAAKHNKNAIRRFACDYCDYRSNYKSHMNAHLLSKHNNDPIKKYSCHLCEYSSKLKYTLNRHLKRMHKVMLTEPIMKEDHNFEKDIPCFTILKCI